VRRCGSVIVLAAACVLPVRAAEPPRGPLPLRDGQVLAQPRLSLPAESGQILSPGQSRLRLGLRWSNSFAWTQDAPGESPRERLFLIDAETAGLDLEWRRGLGRRLEVGLRAQLLWRGGGVLDGFVDGFHRVFAFAGVGDGGRPEFQRNAFRVLGRRRDGEPFEWRERGAGLGPLETQVRWRLSAPRPAQSSWSSAVILRAQVPTGSGAFRGSGVAAALQLVASRPLGRRAYLSAGVGGSAGGARRVDGVGYEPLRGQAFLAFERRLGRRASLLLQTDAATRLVRDIANYPGEHWLAHMGLVFDLGPRVALELSLSENLRAQQATADLAFQAGLRWGY